MKIFKLSMRACFEEVNVKLLIVQPSNSKLSHLSFSLMKKKIDGFGCPDYLS